MSPERRCLRAHDGLDVVRRIIAQAPEFLKPGAFLSMELDPAQCEPVSGMLESAGFESVTIRRDLCGNERVVTGVRWQTRMAPIIAGAVADGSFALKNAGWTLSDNSAGQEEPILGRGMRPKPKHRAC
jgi:hypothetical protein